MAEDRSSLADHRRCLRTCGDDPWRLRQVDLAVLND